MIINWYRYVRLLLPPRLRTSALQEFARVSVWQVVQLYYQFLHWHNKAKYKASITPSVIALEKLISREFDCEATIDELDGRATDFIVRIPQYVDEIKLRAMVEQYKLAGKSFTFKIGTIDFSCEWINHACEDITTIFTAEWIDPVCEDTGVISITSRIYKNTTAGWTVVVEASGNVKSDITVRVNVTGKDENSDLVDIGNFDIVILTDESVTEQVVIDDETAYYQMSTKIMYISPESDEFFIYEEV